MNLNMHRVLIDDYREAVRNSRGQPQCMLCFYLQYPSARALAQMICTSAIDDDQALYIAGCPLHAAADFLESLGCDRFAEQLLSAPSTGESFHAVLFVESGVCLETIGLPTC